MFAAVMERLTDGMLQRRGMTVIRNKTEYTCENERETGVTVKLQGRQTVKVDELKYVGSTIQSNTKRVLAGWSGWRLGSEVICDIRITKLEKWMLYKLVKRPAMMYGLKTVALTKCQKVDLEVEELKVLRFY